MPCAELLAVLLCELETKRQNSLRLAQKDHLHPETDRVVLMKPSGTGSGTASGRSGDRQKRKSNSDPSALHSLGRRMAKAEALEGSGIFLLRKTIIARYYMEDMRHRSRKKLMKLLLPNTKAKLIGAE